jgi:hypothetical protein
MQARTRTPFVDQIKVAIAALADFAAARFPEFEPIRFPHHTGNEIAKVHSDGSTPMYGWTTPTFGNRFHKS